MPARRRCRFSCYGCGIRREITPCYDSYPEQHDVNKPVCNADPARHGYKACACGGAEGEMCSMFTSERTVDSARRESIVMLVNVIGVALASAFLTGQIIWYVWKMQSIGWAPDRSSVMPVLGLLCGIVTLDRKSTRLNSSHTVISYAVFCLKKKKKKETESQDRNIVSMLVRMKT